jgi:hypothetical protein
VKTAARWGVKACPSSHSNSGLNTAVSPHYWRDHVKVSARKLLYLLSIGVCRDLSLSPAQSPHLLSSVDTLPAYCPQTRSHHLHRQCLLHALELAWSLFGDLAMQPPSPMSSSVLGKSRLGSNLPVSQEELRALLHLPPQYCLQLTEVTVDQGRSQQGATR